MMNRMKSSDNANPYIGKIKNCGSQKVEGRCGEKKKTGKVVKA